MMPKTSRTVTALAPPLPGGDDSSSRSAAGEAPRFDPAIVDMVGAGFAASGAAIAVFDPCDRLVFRSEAFASLYDVQPHLQTFEDIMRHCHQFGRGPKFSTDIEPWLAIATAKRRGLPHRTFEIDMTDGRWYWASETTYAGGWVLLFVTDITQLKTNERLLQLARDTALHEAETDALTGLFNRRHVMSVFAHTTAHASETGTPFSIALLDLDHFKQINDAFGHASGDKVLCHFATLVTGNLRQHDILARIGGEEFMLLMPGTGLAAAGRTLERLRDVVDCSVPVPGLPLHYTFSAGLAVCRDECPEDLFQRADRALYAAKQNGRNRVEIAD